MKRLPEADPKPSVFQPYPDYDSAAYKQEYRGSFEPCAGPDGLEIAADSEVRTLAYKGKPEGFPDPDMGSWEAVGLNENVCFDRHARLGPFGLTDGGATSKHDFSRAQWGKLQTACVAKNGNRYRDPSAPLMKAGFKVPHKQQPSPVADLKPPKSRSALLIRTWDNYDYQENDIIAIRSLVSELNLHSGGEYQVFLLVNIKDDKAPIYTDESLYREYLEKAVPAEFRDMAILWTEAICQEWYPNIGEWSVYWQQFMPLQWFSKTHPEFDYIWNWEMDARLIGHHYHFFEAMANFSRKQPRKYLWERNSRYYVPKHHGNWQRYFDDSNDLIEQSKSRDKTNWGPQPWIEDQRVLGPQPPSSEESDNFEWGVGEEADLITLLPIWDPRETWWSYRDRLFNYPKSEASYDERQYPHVPRRVFINTLSRFSTTLLNAMHIENEAGLSMASEMWPASVALQHGFKAVYSPHPIWQSHIWNPEYMDMVFNADGWGAGGMPGGHIDDGRGRGYDKDRETRGLPQAGTGPNGEGLPARWGQERDSPYNPDREHNFAGLSWYFWSDFPRVIYWRWLGWKAAFEVKTISGAKDIDTLGSRGGADVSTSICTL